MRQTRAPGMERACRYERGARTALPLTVASAGTAVARPPQRPFVCPRPPVAVVVSPRPPAGAARPASGPH